MKNTSWVKEQKFGYPRGHPVKEEGVGAVLLLRGQAPSNATNVHHGGGNINHCPPARTGSFGGCSQPRPTSTSEEFLTSCGIRIKS